MNTMKKAALFVLLGILGVTVMAEYLKSHPKTDAYQNWRIGTQAWTFRLFTFY